MLSVVPFSNRILGDFYFTIYTDDDGVSLPEGAEEDGEFRTLLRRAGELFLEDGLASVLFECIDLPVQVLVSGRAAGISDDHGNFVYLVSVTDLNIDFVLHITRYTKLRIRTDVVKNFSKKYVKRWFCKLVNFQKLFARLNKVLYICY